MEDGHDYQRKESTVLPRCSFLPFLDVKPQRGRSTLTWKHRRKIPEEDGGKAEKSIDASGNTLGWVCPYGSFDLDPNNAEGMFILSMSSTTPFPIVTQKFFRRPLVVAQQDVKDPNTGLTGDIWSTTLPDNTQRFFMFVVDFPGSSSGHTITFYNSQGHATRFCDAIFAPKSN